MICKLITPVEKLAMGVDLIRLGERTAVWIGDSIFCVLRFRIPPALLKDSVSF